MKLAPTILPLDYEFEHPFAGVALIGPDETTIAYLRELLGLTQTQFAQELGVTRAAVAKWEGASELTAYLRKKTIPRAFERASQILAREHGASIEAARLTLQSLTLNSACATREEWIDLLHLAPDLLDGVPIAVVAFNTPYLSSLDVGHALIACLGGRRYRDLVRDDAWRFDPQKVVQSRDRLNRAVREEWEWRTTQAGIESQRERFIRELKHSHPIFRKWGRDEELTRPIATGET